MEKAFEKGISPNEYRKCFSKDLQMIEAIKQAKSGKQQMKKQAQELMNEMN